MSKEKTVSEDALHKAIDEIKKLAGGGEELVKGHISRGTATTKVETMQPEGPATQVFHTPSNSDPGTWAGSSASECPENGATDSVDSGGTDYKGASAMMKSVLELVAKGQISADAAAVILSKAGMSYSMDKDEEDEKEDDVKKADSCDYEDDDKKEDKDMAKSLLESAQENPELLKGFEVSEFLSELTGEISKAIQRSTNELKSYVDSKLQKSTNQQETFNKSLAGALSNFSEVVALQGQRISQVEQSPARPPMSVASAAEVQPLSKSFAGSEPAGEQKLTKAQILDTMTDMVIKGELPSTAVVKFDTTGELDPQVYSSVLAHRNGK